jgi:hypothetical protein
MKTTTYNTSGPVGRQLTVRRLCRGAAFLTAIVVSTISTVTMRAEPPWSPPVTLSAPAINAHTPAVAASDTGTMVATWVRQEGSIYEVQASINKNGTWTQPVNLSRTGQSAFDSTVAIDRNGIATAVWSVGDTIQTSTYLPWARGSGWSTPVSLSEVGASAISPRIVADAAGNVTAMWVRYNVNGVPGVETASRTALGKWSAPKLLAPGAPRDLTLVTNAGGDAAAIWETGAFTSNTTIYVSTKPRFSGWPGGWSAPYVIAPLAYRQGGGRIGIAANGDVTACWRTNTDIRVADKPAHGNWGSPNVVYSDRALSAYPTLAVTPSGDVMAAWITYVWTGGSYNYQIGTSVRPAGGVWGAPALLTASSEYDSELNAATTNSGACVLTWVDINSGLHKSATWSIKKGWYDLLTIASGSDTALAVGGDTALAIWMAGSFQANVSTALIQ